MDPVIIILIEVSQTEKDKHGMILLFSDVASKNERNEFIYKAERET